MNKYKEAQSKIARTLVRIIGYPTFASQVEKDFDVLDELVEKATPKKAKETHYAPYHTFCSVCGGLVFDNFNYCPKCGQALDWSEEDA